MNLLKKIFGSNEDKIIRYDLSSSRIQSLPITISLPKGTYCYTINLKSMNWESSETRVYNGKNYQSKHNLKSYQKVDTKSSAVCHSKNIIHYPIMVVEGLAKS